MQVEMGQLLLMVLALVLVLEGVGPFAFPKYWRAMLQNMLSLSESGLRITGLVMIALGLAVFMMMVP